MDLRNTCELFFFFLSLGVFEVRNRMVGLLLDRPHQKLRSLAVYDCCCLGLERRLLSGPVLFRISLEWLLPIKNARQNDTWREKALVQLRTPGQRVGCHKAVYIHQTGKLCVGTVMNCPLGEMVIVFWSVLFASWNEIGQRLHPLPVHVSCSDHCKLAKEFKVS